MAGGLLNLVSSGVQNVILNGNPEKTYWTSTYKRYTNFGMQNFRLDFEGLRQLSLTTPTTFTFKVKRYADLVMDMWLVVQLPDIYSPIFPPTDPQTGEWVPYEFRWIKNIGAMMVNTINFTVGGALIQSITGTQMVALANRDLSAEQKAKWDQAVGNIPELYDPANAQGRSNMYPNAVYTPRQGACLGAEPSIRGRQLYIPIPVWWAMTSQHAFPLICLQYNELQVEVNFRPIRELFQVRDLFSILHEYIAPNFNLCDYRMHRFLQSPPNVSLTYDEGSAVNWNENIHLSTTYCFLSDEEGDIFARSNQNYLVRELYETTFHNVGVTDKVWLQNSTGLVTSWMMMFQRSDVPLRNEWSNYTVWPFDKPPYPVTKLGYTVADSPIAEAYTFSTPDGDIIIEAGKLGYGLNPNGTLSNLYSSGELSNRKDILVSLGILLDGALREEVRPAGVFQYQQQYLASPGFGSSTLNGLYCYNFCLNTSPFNLQPSGAINLSKYSKIELEFETIEPAPNPDSTFYTICDADTNALIGVSKQSSNIYLYTFNLIVIEERFNILSFVGGNAALMVAR
jgi:hypothetical protein